MEMMLEVNGISKSYQDFTLNKVSFNLPTGTIMGFVGENGAGKTTTLKAILSAIKLDSGSVNIFGKSIKDAPEEIKQQIGVVFDENHFPEMLTPKDVGKILKGAYQNFDMEAYSAFLKRFYLNEKKKIKTFSRGMKMKLSFAAAMSHGAKLLLLDEPTSGLDPIARREILDLLLEFIEDGEKSVLLSSHITSDLEKICDYITFIHDGKVLFCEQKDELLENYGVLKGSKADVLKMDSADVLGKSFNQFGAEVLVKNMPEMKKKYPDLVADKGTIDDIMVLIVGEGASCED